jgi:prepilin-type N-terminal cleavage/methylation domain-containing protein
MRLAKLTWRMRSLRNSRPRRAGYTLIELMMVVLIIGSSVLAFAPGISRAMAERRVSTAARELIRLGRRARSDSFGYLRAHLVWITPANGRVQLLRGPTNSCVYADWATIQAECDATPVGANCVEDFRVENFTSGSGAIGLYEETGSTATPAYTSATRALCYTASGILQHTTGFALPLVTTNLSESNDVNGGFVYTLHSGSVEPDAAAGDRVHRVLFPLGSSPRSWR